MVTPEKERSEGQDFDIPENWTFEREDIARIFDAHVREQLPWYDIVTRAVQQIARNYITPESVIYDIGASTGNIGRSLEEVIKDRGARFIGVEKSKEMAEKYEAPGELIIKDALEVEYEPCSLVICFLILMFLKPTDKKILLDKLLSSIVDGGALIIVDKRETEQGYVGTILHRLTLSEKLNSGVHPERIIEKELSLSGVQRPMRPKDIPEGAIEFFRFGEFSGWVVEK